MNRIIHRAAALALMLATLAATPALAAADEPVPPLPGWAAIEVVPLVRETTRNGRLGDELLGAAVTWSWGDAPGRSTRPEDRRLTGVPAGTPLGQLLAENGFPAALGWVWLTKAGAPGPYVPSLTRTTWTALPPNGVMVEEAEPSLAALTAGSLPVAPVGLIIGEPVSATSEVHLPWATAAGWNLGFGELTRPVPAAPGKVVGDLVVASWLSDWGPPELLGAARLIQMTDGRTIAMAGPDTRLASLLLQFGWRARDDGWIEVRAAAPPGYGIRYTDDPQELAPLAARFRPPQPEARIAELLRDFEEPSVDLAALGGPTADDWAGYIFVTFPADVH